MSQLVDEVRALRESVERSGLIAAQSQLLLGRVQLQEGRLATLGRQAQDARDRLADAERDQSAVEHQLRQLNAAIDRVQSADEREMLVNDRIPQFKEQVRQAQLKTQQLRSQEAAASSALSEEQSRWLDFNTRLETLERTLATMAAARVRP
jgi:chromosome segregation ATPase